MKQARLLLISALLILSGHSVYAGQTRTGMMRIETERVALKGRLEIPGADTVQILTTQDGAMNIGRIVELGTDEIQFETNFGTMTISVENIEEIRGVPRSAIRQGKYWAPNPNTSRLFFAPTGRMLKQGEGYFADYFVFFPCVTYGLTDRLTFGGGMSLFPGGTEQLFYFTPKVGIVSSESTNLAAGALIVKMPGDSDVASIGVLYGVGTFGSPDASLTVGLGYGYSDGNLAERPVIMVGGEKRLSRRTAFVSENWVYPGENPLVSGGLRFFGEKLCVDFGIVTVLGAKNAGFAPYIDFVVTF